MKNLLFRATCIGNVITNIVGTANEFTNEFNSLRNKCITMNLPPIFKK